MDTDSEIFGIGGKEINGYPPELLTDGIISRWNMPLEDNFGAPGVEVTPAHGMPSIVKGIRIYAADCCWANVPGAFLIQGRNSRADAWTTIAGQDLCISSGEYFDMCKHGYFNNGERLGKPLNSTFSSPDMELEHMAVTFPNDSAFLTYRVTFPKFANRQTYQERIDQGSNDRIIFGALELPGEIIY